MNNDYELPFFAKNFPLLGFCPGFCFICLKMSNVLKYF